MFSVSTLQNGETRIQVTAIAMDFNKLIKSILIGSSTPAKSCALKQWQQCESELMQAHAGGQECFNLDDTSKSTCIFIMAKVWQKKLWAMRLM